MTVRRSLVAQGLLLVAALVFTLALAARMPDRVVTHWNLQGEPDGWGGKWGLLLLVPLVQAVMAVLTAVLPAASPAEYRIERFGKVYGGIMFGLAVMMAAIHAVIVLKAAGAAYDVGRALFVVLFAAWIPLGNVLGKTRRNFYMGIRTPWTLASEDVWNATHRAAGRLWVAGGALGLGAAWAGAPLGFLIAFLVVLSFVPIVQSYFIDRRIGGA